jgi:DNA-binding MarR family transcriptional regulator
MTPATSSGVERSPQVEHVSTQLLPRAALLTRLFARQVGGGLSRTEAELLNTLSGGARRITELADLGGLAQPTMTLLVKRLEDQGLVARERNADDGRVVMVTLTPTGLAALEDFRSQISAALREHLAEMSPEQIEALAAAADALQDLITLLQSAVSQ